MKRTYIILVSIIVLLIIVLFGVRSIVPDEPARDFSNILLTRHTSPSNTITVGSLVNPLVQESLPSNPMEMADEEIINFVTRNETQLVTINSTLNTLGTPTLIPGDGSSIGDARQIAFALSAYARYLNIEGQGQEMISVLDSIWQTGDAMFKVQNLDMETYFAGITFRKIGYLTLDRIIEDTSFLEDIDSLVALLEIPGYSPNAFVRLARHEYASIHNRFQKCADYKTCRDEFVGNKILKAPWIARPIMSQKYYFLKNTTANMFGDTFTTIINQAQSQNVCSSVNILGDKEDGWFMNKNVLGDFSHEAVAMVFDRIIKQECTNWNTIEQSKRALQFKRAQLEDAIDETDTEQREEAVLEEI
jgi:hypothetical protein